MIKKLNVALVVAIVAILAMKGAARLSSAARERKAAKAAAAAESRQKGEALPAPNVYYEYWSGYSVVDPISNRNGILLDVVRAIFPDAKFRNVSGGTSAFAKALAEDPTAVVVGFGEHPAFKGVAFAPTPMAYFPIVVMTLRSNPWKYVGPKSLESLRILASETFLDAKVLREMHERGAPNLKVMPPSVSKVEFADMVERGKADAFVMTGNVDISDGVMDGFASARLVQRFRSSPDIGSDGALLFVSGLDPDFRKRVVDEYEAGIRRLKASGELDRIFGYYGMTPHAIPPAGN